MNAAGWYFKTLAAQEPGESNVLMALYGNQSKDTEVFTDFLPFFGTDYGLCSLIKPQVRARNRADSGSGTAALLSAGRREAPSALGGPETLWLASNWEATPNNGAVAANQPINRNF